MNRKLPLIQSRWKRIFLSLYLSWLILLGVLMRRRARIHWVGGKRPHRPERPFAFLIIFGAMLVLELQDFLLWSTLWGSGLAILFNLHTAYSLVPRRRYHWVGRK